MKFYHWMTAFLFCAALALFVFSPVARAAETPPMKVIVGTSYPNVDVMPIYISRELGYFQEENVSVDLISLATGDKIVFALLGGSINVARYTPDWIIRAIEKGGAKLKIVLAGSNNLVFSLIAANDIKSYADLKGKRVGVSTIAAADFDAYPEDACRPWPRQGGLQPHSVRVEPGTGGRVASRVTVRNPADPSGRPEGPGRRGL